MGKKEGGGGKAKKKKWSKGKTRDKLNNLVLFDKGTYDKLYKEVPTYKLITPSIVSERLKVRGSLARRALIELMEKGMIKQVVAHSSQMIYTRMIGDKEATTPRLREASWWHRRLRRRARARRTRPTRRPRPRLKPPPKPSSSKSMY